jgi:hypothetical protein
VSLVLDPISTQSGEALEHRLPRTWVIGLLIGSAALHRAERRVQRAPGATAVPPWTGPAITAICVAAALGTMVEVILIGHSGAVAAWSGVGA